MKSPLGQCKLVRVGGEQEVCEIWLFRFPLPVLVYSLIWGEPCDQTRSITCLRVNIFNRCQEMCVWVCRHTLWAFGTKPMTYAIHKTVLSLMFPMSDFNSVQKKKKNKGNTSWRQNHLWYMCWGGERPTYLAGRVLGVGNQPRSSQWRCPLSSRTWWDEWWVFRFSGVSV